MMFIILSVITSGVLWHGVALSVSRGMTVTHYADKIDLVTEKIYYDFVICHLIIAIRLLFLQLNSII